MKARWRLVVYVALTVALLLAVPAALPPDMGATYGSPPWTSTTDWIYGVASTEGGPREAGSPLLEISVRNVTPLSNNTYGATVVASVTNGALPDWILVSWDISLSNLGWRNLSWPCDGGDQWARLATPLPWGGSAPFGTTEIFDESSTTLESGNCADGPGTATVEGVQAMVMPPKGPDCSLYLCNEERMYNISADLTLKSPSGDILLDEFWQGLYDPEISGYRWLSVGPADAPGDRGAVNLTLLSYHTVSTQPDPEPLFGIAESIGLIFLGPGLAILSEMMLSKRETRREQEERHAFIRTLAGPELKAPPPPDPEDLEAFEPPRD